MARKCERSHHMRVAGEFTMRRCDRESEWILVIKGRYVGMGADKHFRFNIVERLCGIHAGETIQAEKAEVASGMIVNSVIKIIHIESGTGTSVYPDRPDMPTRITQRNHPVILVGADR